MAEQNSALISLPADQLPVGAKLQVLKQLDEEQFWREGEVLATRVSAENASKYEFYIHYTNFNKRLDEWVPQDRLNLDTVVLPKPEPTKSAQQKKKSAKKASKRDSSASMLSIAAGDDLNQDDKLPIMDVDNEDEQADGSRIRSKAEEIEALRRGGSMTQRPEEVHRVKNISAIVIGQHKVETWYFSPYPAEYTLNDVVYICEFCLLFFNDQTRFSRHRQKCNVFHPPGNEIYRKDNISFFELDGHKQRTYCRNLCLLSKLFLDHKTLYYDVNPFLFYIMTQNDEHGCHIVGYFSKEKDSLDGYNVACILTLPNHQRKGYGRLLIQFSYLLSKVEGKLGSPEKPLSDLGLLSYRSFWSEIILEHLFTTDESEISVTQLATILSMTTDDVMHTLQHLDLLRYYNGQYIMALNNRHREMYNKFVKKRKVSIDPACLDWKPPVFSATQLRYI